MSVFVKGNYFFVQPGQKAYKVASNFTNYFELGTYGITEYYLEAKIDKGEFIINASLLDKHGKTVCNIANSMPNDPVCTKKMTSYGYCFLSETGSILLSIEAKDEHICILRGKIYDIDGKLVAEDNDDDFLVYHGPAVFGKSGNVRGMMIG